MPKRKAEVALCSKDDAESVRIITDTMKRVAQLMGRGTIMQHIWNMNKEAKLFHGLKKLLFKSEETRALFLEPLVQWPIHYRRTQFQWLEQNVWNTVQILLHFKPIDISVQGRSLDQFLSHDLECPLVAWRLVEFCGCDSKGSARLLSQKWFVDVKTMTSRIESTEIDAEAKDGTTLVIDGQVVQLNTSEVETKCEEALLHSTTLITDLARLVVQYIL